MSTAPRLETASHPLWVIVESRPPEPYAEVFRGWDLRELTEGGVQWWAGEPFGSYRVALSRQVEDAHDAGMDFIQGCYIARDINRFYAYATGRILNDAGLPSLALDVRPPEGWVTNGAEVIDKSDWDILHSGSTSTPDFRVLPRFPLASVISIMEAYYKTDDLTWALVDHHLAGISTREDDTHHLLLAKALEIARELLPGASNIAKAAALPVYVRDRLKRPFAWLFEASNMRRQTRHPITKLPSLELHPSFEPDEERDFSHDADIVLRYVAVKRLNAPFVYVDGHRTIEAV
jgi:hypothetical protein